MTLHAGCAVSSRAVWAATYHLPLPGIALNIGNQLLLLRLELGPLAVELAPRTLQSTQVLAQALLGLLSTDRLDADTWDDFEATLILSLIHI